MSRETGLVVAVWAALAAATLLLAVPRMTELGLYYDEAFMAQQARDFVEPERQGTHPHTTRQVRLFGRSYPLRNAAYLGSLKSQLTIPALAVFGSNLPVLRTTTLVWGLLGLLLAMLWASRCFGIPTALAAGVLVASDPSFYFLAQFEWGPFTTGLLCRAGGFLLLAAAWQRRQTLLFFLGGLVLGLGVYSRVDFVVVLGAAGVGLVVAQPTMIRTLLGEARRQTLVALLGFALTATTMLLSARQILSTGGAIADRGGLGYKLFVLWSTLDGSHFQRLLEVGGLFDMMMHAPSRTGLFGAAVVVAAAVVALRRILGQRQEPGHIFLLVTSLLVAGGMLAIPGAVRAHHMLNLMPFGHLLVASVLVLPWSASLASSRWSGVAPRAAALALCAIIVASQLLVLLDARQFIQDTGGRGRWSDALVRLQPSLDRSSESVVVSLDWGFHEPLQFLSDRAVLREPIWQIPRALQQGRPWSLEGDEHHVYLVHLPPYDLFQLSEPFLELASNQGRWSRIETHADREGKPAFASVRFSRPHTLVFDGRFSLQLR